MIVKLCNRKALIDRAKYLLTKYPLSTLEALKWAEQEIEEIQKRGYENE